jgi:hypothetical protein
MKIDARTTSEMTETTTDSENETHAGTTIADTFALSSGFCASAWMATNTAASPDRSKHSPKRLHAIFASRCTIESSTAFAFVPCFANKYLRAGPSGWWRHDDTGTAAPGAATVEVGHTALPEAQAW